VKTPTIFTSGQAARQLRAFTLTEMLVAIAIVGLLATLLANSAGSVKKSSQRAACSSNLRQISAGILLYAADHDNYLPKAWEPEGSWPTWTWMYQVQPYLEEKEHGMHPDNLSLCYAGVFRCLGKADWNIYNANDQAKISYSMNTFDPVNGIPKLIRLNSIERPSRTLLVGEVETGNAALANGDWLYRSPKPALRHAKRDNVLFADGHVEEVPVDGLDWALQRVDNP
jgi:general secretion pathway protein G